MLFLATSLPSLVAQAENAKDDTAYSTSTQSNKFSTFLRQFRPIAINSGISRKLYDNVTRGLTPDKRVLKLLGSQPEFNSQIWTYLEKRVSPQRITTGKKKKQQYAKAIAAIEQRYGVDRHILLSIWGMESNFGSFKGNMSTIRSLATMAYQGRRKNFGRIQLLAALKILQNGDISPKQFKGSWAGAMGHTQFIPATYNAHAVDWTGDGKRDVWNSVEDALASTANYLRKAGWRSNRPWGWEVKLPAKFDYSLAGKSGSRTVSKWVRLGIRPASFKNFGGFNEITRLIIPAGSKGPAFLITDNYKAILAYNRSHSYALAVGHLADRIAGRGKFKTSWPVGDKPFNRAERKELQRLLTAKGFNTGGIDGRMGGKTLAAIAAYQKSIGLISDGYANQSLLNRLRSNK